MLASKEKIKDLFLTKIQPHSSSLLKARNQSYKNMLFIWLVLLSIAGYIFNHFKIHVNSQHFLTAVFFVLALMFFIAVSAMKSFKKKYKLVVIKKVFENLLAECTYSPESFLLSHKINDSKLIRDHYNIFKGEDYVKGRLGDLPLEFSELLIQKQTGSGKNKKTKTIFKGLFFIIELPNNLNQKTLILNDKTENFFGRNLARSLQGFSTPEGYELVHLEDVQFEKIYSVYSDNQILVRKLLSPKVLQEMLEFRTLYKRPLEISLKDRFLFISIPSNKNMFEPKYFGEIISFHDIREIYNIFEMIIDLQKSLDIISD